MITLVGSGLDALVASTDLWRKGIEHQLVSDEERLGGHFRGLIANCGTLVDFGMVLLEKDSREVSQMAIDTYSGLAGSSIRPYINEIFSWIDIELDTSPVVVHKQSAIVGDFFISDDLSFIRHLPEQTKVQVQKEIERILARPESHPRLKDTNSEFSHLHVGDALIGTIGPTLYTLLFEHWVNAFDPEKQVCARDHRLIWLPLYWPETILASIQSLPENVSPITFYQPKGFPLSDFVRRLAFNARPRLIDKHSQESPRSISFENRGSHSRSPKKTVVIVHYCVPNASLGTHFFPDLEDGISRVHFSTGASQNAPGEIVHVASIEFPNSNLSESEALQPAAAFLRKLGLEPQCEGHASKANVPLARHSVRDKIFDPLRSLFGDFGTSFNDQIARGLAASRAIANSDWM